MTNSLVHPGYPANISWLTHAYRKDTINQCIFRRVREARDKALVENAVGLVYQRIYAPLRNTAFCSLEELNKAVWSLLEDHNNNPFQRLNTSRRGNFEEVEKRALKPLPTERYPSKTIKVLTVQINYQVELREDRHFNPVVIIRDLKKHLYCNTKKCSTVV